jgi:hypothetical protein
MKMRLEEDLENRKKLMQEKVYDENSSFLEAQDDSQMTDISHETFPGIICIYFFICACLVIFFEFLQSDWLQQRAAFYDIFTVVQNSYFFAKNRGVKTIFKLKV